MSQPPSPKKAKIVKVVRLVPNKPSQTADPPGKKCIVESCTSSASDPLTTALKLPDNNSRRLQWLTLCGRTDLIGSPDYTKHFICADHFQSSDFTGPSRVKVKAGALPSILNLTPECLAKATGVAPNNYASPSTSKTAIKETVQKTEDEEITVLDSTPAKPSKQNVAAPQQFFLLTPSEPNKGTGPMIISAAQLQQQIMVNPGKPATKVPTLVPFGSEKQATGSTGSEGATVVSPQVARAPQASGGATTAQKPKPNKMVITVPKSLYKEYKDGQITLEELTIKAKKIVNKEGLAKVQENKKKQAAIKQPITLPAPEKIYRMTKTVAPLLDQVNKTLENKPEPISIKRAPPLSVPAEPAKPLHQVETALNNPQISAQVHQVAPRLPIRARGATYNLQKWDVLIPRPFRDWPVPASVVFAAAMQLKQNYNENFNGKERLEIETVLHMAGHYLSLCANSRCHVRERIHFYLKKMQQELVVGKEMEAKKKKKRAAQDAQVAQQGNEQNQQPNEMAKEEQNDNQMGFSEVEDNVDQSTAHDDITDFSSVL